MGWQSAGSVCFFHCAIGGLSTDDKVERKKVCLSRQDLWNKEITVGKHFMLCVHVTKYDKGTFGCKTDRKLTLQWSSCEVYFLYLLLVLLPSVLWRCWLGGRKGIQLVKNWVVGCWGEVVCLEWGADLHVAQLMPLPLAVSYFSKVQIGFTI